MQTRKYYQTIKRCLETTLAEQKEHLGPHVQFRFRYYLNHMTSGKPITVVSGEEYNYMFTEVASNSKYCFQWVLVK